MLQYSYSSNRIRGGVGPIHPGPSSAAPSTSTLVFPLTTGATTTRHASSSRTSHSPDLLVSPTSPPQADSKSSFEYAYPRNADTTSSSSSSSSASVPQTSVSTPMPPPSTIWPPPLLPSTARNAAQFEAYAPLNLGADEDEQVWAGESVGLGFGLLTKGKVGIDAVNWDCRICEKTANDPCVTRCGHLFCWTHLREHLMASSASSATCPTCKTPTRMDRDVVQVFGRPKVVPADAPWTSGAGSGASTCSFGPMSGGNPSSIDLTMQSQPTELPGPTDLDDESPYLVAQNRIYMPVLSTPHSREMSLGKYGKQSILGLDINLDNPAISASPEAALLPPPPSSPVLGGFKLSSSPSEHSPVNANHPSGLASVRFQHEYEHNRQASRFSWVTTSGTSGPGSMQLSQSSSSLWGDGSSCGSRSRSNTIDLRDEDDQPSPEPVAPTPRRISLTSRPMKGFWATKTPMKWLPPAPEEEPPAPPIPRIEIRAATYEETPRRSSRLRTKGWHPGSSMFTFAPTESPPSQVGGVASSSDSDESLSRFRPQRYDHSSGGEPPLSRRDEPWQRNRTPSRKVFRNMDVDFVEAPSAATAAAAAREAALRAIDEEQNPLGRAIMLLALALFLMVLLK